MTPSTTAGPGLRFASSRLQKLERVSGRNATVKRAVAHLLHLGTSKNPVVPAYARTQSFQVLENTMDWIPAYAGMTNF